MTSILVEYYTMLLREGYYPRRQLKLVDVTLEKGKRPIISKLRTITLIEWDLQILMRKYLNSEDEELIEYDNRFSKANYSSRKNYSIEIAILEQRLIFNSSLLLTKPVIYNLIDLQSCYNCQLVNIRSILEELVG